MNAVLPFPEPQSPDPKRAEASPSSAPWSQPAQLAVAFLLGVAVTLLTTTLFQSLISPGPTQLVSPASQPSAENVTPSQSQPPLYSASKGKPSPVEGSIDLNRASAAELMTLPGIGPALSQRIIDHRSREPFQTVADLDRVPGIGPKTLEKLRPFVTVGLNAAARPKD